jgi:hypothetical protein
LRGYLTTLVVQPVPDVLGSRLDLPTTLFASPDDLIAKQ